MKATLSTKKRIDVRASKVDGILNYDVDNAYPNRVIDIINNSVTGVACTKLFAKFIQGKGFKDQKFYKTVVNKNGLTNDKFLRKLAVDWSKIGYVGIHINFNALYEAVEFTPIPSQFLRLTTSDNEEHPNEVVNYDNWDRRKSSRIIKDDFQYFNHFNIDPAFIQAQVEAAGGWDNYRGQVWIVSKEGAEYVLAPCDTVLEDMQTEGEAKLFKYRNITSNYLASHFLIVDKKENSGIERAAESGSEPDETGRLIRRESRESSQQQEAFLNSIIDFQGADNALKIAVIEKDYPEQTFKLEKVEIQDVEDLYVFTESSVRDNIIRCFLQPPILVAIQVSGKLGTSKEMKDATDYYNSVTEEDRIAFEEIFAKLFSIWHDKSINTTGDYSIIPIEAKSDLEITEINKILDSGATPEEKRERLIILFNFSDEEAKRMVADKPAPVT